MAFKPEVLLKTLIDKVMSQHGVENDELAKDLVDVFEKVATPPKKKNAVTPARTDYNGILKAVSALMTHRANLDKEGYKPKYKEDELDSFRQMALALHEPEKAPESFKELKDVAKSRFMAMTTMGEALDVLLESSSYEDGNVPSRMSVAGYIRQCTK